MVKLCCACKIEKTSDAFSPDRRASDGLQSRCRGCANALRRAAYDANPEHFRKRQRDYGAKNPEIVKAVAARMRVKHAESLKASKKRKYVLGATRLNA